jgi:hypothetical protein
MSGMEESQLVNTIGHSAGAIIFGIFLVLLLRDRAPTGLRSSWRSLSAAALAFLWNIGSLAVLTHSLGSRSDLHFERSRHISRIRRSNVYTGTQL